jgi:hypothetical protein
MVKGQRNIIWVSVDDLVSKDLNYKKSIAFLIKVKMHFANSIVYDYNPKKLAIKIGVSEYLIKKHVDSLFKLNMCRTEGRHLVFRSLNKVFINYKRKHSIDIDKSISVNNIVSEIDWLILQQNVNQQNYAYLEKADIRLMEAGRYLDCDTKKIKRLAKKRDKLREGLSKNNVIGMRKLALLIGSSTSRALKLIHERKRDGYLRTRKVIVGLGIKHTNKQRTDRMVYGLDDIEMQKKYFGYYFRIGNTAYRYLGTQLIVV